MRRKYLDDIGVTDRHDTWYDDENDPEKDVKFNTQRAIYGFDERETYALDHAFYCWLYERLIMFLEVNNVDLEFHKFEYKGEEYTQKQLIDMMIVNLKFVLSKEFDDYNDEHREIAKSISEIWSLVLPAMWW